MVEKIRCLGCEKETIDELKAYEDLVKGAKVLKCPCCGAENSVADVDIRVGDGKSSSPTFFCCSVKRGSA